MQKHKEILREFLVISLAFIIMGFIFASFTHAALPQPTVSIINPKPGTSATPTVISLRPAPDNNFKVQVKVWNDVAISAGTVQVGYYTGATPDAGPFTWVTASLNANYPNAVNYGVYEAWLSLTAGTNYYLQARASENVGLTPPYGYSSDNRTGNDARYVYVSVKASKTGTGMLLGRDASSQLCSDCHEKTVSHSSGTTDTGYGNWQLVCLECHTPHSTKNIYLIKETITTPNSGNKPVVLWNTSGDAAYSYVVAVSGAATQGVCQVCHTQTTGSGTSRWRNTGNSESPAHYGAPSTQRCTACHGHTGGFQASCASCHGNPPVVDAATSPNGLVWMLPVTGSSTAGKHTLHATSGGSNRNYACDVCHYQNISQGKHSTDPRNITMGFYMFNGAYQGGSYGGQILAPANYDATTTSPITTVSETGTKQCSNIYCHGIPSVGQTLGGGSNMTPAWNGTSACGTCHGANTASTTNSPTRGSHSKHTGGGLQLPCSDCHSGRTPAVIPSGMATHVNNASDFSFDSAKTYIGSASYNGTTTMLDAYGSCSSLYCHSNGKVGTSVGVYTTPTWGSASITCSGCHGIGTAAGTPNYANEGAGTVGANSHTKHTGAGTSTCVYCHQTTTTTGTTITGTVHIDNTRNVAAGGGKTFTWVPQTCSSISCHGGNGAQWGATLTCVDCHSGAGDVDDTVYDNGTTARIDSTEWTARGHGQTGATLPLTCDYCHNGGGVLHGVTTNPFRLANNNVLGNGLNDACNVCHKTGGSGYNPGGGVKTALTKVNKYHYGSNHSATRNGGQFCWDCHDPHGDTVNQIKMVQAKPAKKSSTYGVPTQLPANPVIFTNNTIATGAGGFAMTSGTFENGICNTCHTYSASAPTVTYYTSTSSTSHNSATLCTNCHKHSSDTTYNGEAFKGGGCNGCHSYDTVAGSWGSSPKSIEGYGAHAKHIDHIKTRYSVALDANADTFGAGAAAKVCGTCHTNAAVDHSTGGGPRSINFGDGRYKEGSTTGADGFSFLFDPAATAILPAVLPRPQYNGVVGNSSAVNPKSCSVAGCHFTTTPVWQAY